MNIIQFDDNRFPWVLPGVIPVRCGVSVGQSLEDWFFSLATGWAKDDGPTRKAEGLFLIHAHGRFTPDGIRQDLDGVEILKHIRLTPWLGAMRTWHAIVYSFESVEHVLRRKRNDLIVLSGGVTFLRLPDALDLRETLLRAYPSHDDRWPALNNKAWPNLELQDILSNLAKGVATPEDCNFRPYVACDYTAPDSDHEISNWWGVRQLALCARKIAGGNDALEDPSAVQLELKKLENKKAFFLAGGQSPGAKSAEARPHRTELKKLWKLFSPGSKPPKIVYVDDEMDKGWDEAMCYLLTGGDLPKPNGFPWFHTTMGELAQSGNKDKDWQSLAAMVLELKPDLILTDLRLLGSGDSGVAVENTSGAKLIGFLREKAAAVPILLMTASNKAWTLQASLRLGIDAYWMKEGIGDHAAPSKSLENSSELVRLISTLLGENYQTLRRIHERIDKLESQWDTLDPPWWKEMTWPPPEPAPILPVPDFLTNTKSNKDDAFDMLRNLVHMYREYLRLFRLRYGPAGLTGYYPRNRVGTKEEVHARAQRNAETADFWLRSIVVQVGRIVECVHRVDIIRKRGRNTLYQNGGVIGGFVDKQVKPYVRRRIRRDWFGRALYDIRNSAAHFNPEPEAPAFEYANLRSLLAALLAWLSVRPQHLDCLDDSWPKAVDFFTGPYFDKNLVDEYSSLFGSNSLKLP